MMIIEREKEIGKRKQAIIQTNFVLVGPQEVCFLCLYVFAKFYAHPVKEKIGAQSSNAKSERKREFGINNNIQSSEPNGSALMNE